MGITGLLPALKSIQKPCSLKKFAGQTIGVDAYGWLHRGIAACAVELATNKPSKKFVDFAMHRVRMLLHFGITPFLVFDGDFLPSKARTEEGRNARRQQSRKAGLELLAAGKYSQAHLELQKAIDVTPAMARQLIDELKQTGIRYVVAPYEADAQLVYMERKNLIQGILSEDSDLLVFGAKCLLTKLDQYGACIEINRADFCACREMAMTGWSDAQFRQMAILSGCDYLNSITNMGLKTAHRMIRKYKTIEQVVRMLQFDGKYSVPKDYLKSFRQAEQTFLHQRVFCLEDRIVVVHTQPEGELDLHSMPFIGGHIDAHTARGVACGDLDPFTKLPMTAARPTHTFPAAARARPSDRAFKSQSGSDKCFRSDQHSKPKRVPLSELSPNCFTPSPSQQDLLLYNSIARPSAATARSSQDMETPSAARIESSSSVSSNLRTRTPCPVSINPDSPPSKRTRLCADHNSPPKSTDEDGAACHSQYFHYAPTADTNVLSKNLSQDTHIDKEKIPATPVEQVLTSSIHSEDSPHRFLKSKVIFAVYEDDPEPRVRNTVSTQHISAVPSILEHGLDTKLTPAALCGKTGDDRHFRSSREYKQDLPLSGLISSRREDTIMMVPRHKSRPDGQAPNISRPSNPSNRSRIPLPKPVKTSVIRCSKDNGMSESRQLNVHTAWEALTSNSSAISIGLGKCNTPSQYQPSRMISKSRIASSSAVGRSLLSNGASKSKDPPVSDRNIMRELPQSDGLIQGSEDLISHSSDSEWVPPKLDVSPCGALCTST